MIVNEIRLKPIKDRLSRLKGKTGIQNGIHCRWALCYSLSEPTIPTDVEYVADSNVEMTWHVLVESLANI